LQFDITFALSSTGQSPGMQSVEVDVIDLVDGSIVSRIQAQAPTNGPYTFGLANITRAPFLRTSSVHPMPPGNYEVRLLMDLTSPTGPLTQGLLTIDNVLLLPEPSTLALAAAGFLAVAAWRLRRRPRVSDRGSPLAPSAAQ
jgi:hypothetical protein